SAAIVRAPLDVRMNGQRKGESIVLLDGDDAWLGVEALHDMGVQSFEGIRRRQDGRDWVSLGSLAPQLRFALDERTLTLDLTVGPGLMASGTIDVGNARPAGTLMGDATSGFVNYAGQLDLQGRVSAFGEAGVSSGPALLSSAFAYAAAGAPVRGVSAFTYDFLPRLETLTVGDAVVSAGPIGTSGVVGGVTWARNFKLDPYLVVAPRPSFTAFAPTPSTVEVWVNGMLVRQQSVPAGTLDLTNLPVLSGAGDVRTVVRDAFGREQVFDLRSNMAPSLLAPGLTDFAYTLGFVRERVDTSSIAYGRPVALGRHRIGIDEVVTVGARAEASLDRLMAGPSLTLGTVVGQVDLEAVGSVAGGTTGAAGSLGWSWSGRRWAGGLRLRGTTPGFATAVLDPWRDRAVADLGGNFSVTPIDRLNLGLDVAATRWRDAGDSAQASLRASVAIGLGLTAIASVTQTVGGPVPGPSGLLTLTWTIGDHATAQASAGAGAQGVNGMASVARPLPLGPGYGYRVEGAVAADSARAAGAVQYQTGFGRYEAEVDQLGSSTQGAVRAAGGIVVAGDRVFATRPVEEAYALVRVGVPGVTTYLENQPVGVTDGEGDLLVPSLLARYSNRLSIRVADIPMDFEVGKVERLAAPFRKGGVVVRFDVTPIRAAVGRLQLRDGAAAPPGGGELVVVQDGVPLRAPTSSDGRFFLEGVKPGTHAAEVTWRGGTCRANLSILEKAGVQDLGDVTCEAGPSRVAAR
ncbi:MAG: fimbria/pilus outer membrane usher protein, partial [Anaeromyxobacteraceae bacterium]